MPIESRRFRHFVFNKTSKSETRTSAFGSGASLFAIFVLVYAFESYALVNVPRAKSLKVGVVTGITGTYKWGATAPDDVFVSPVFYESTATII